MATLLRSPRAPEAYGGDARGMPRLQGRLPVSKRHPERGSSKAFDALRQTELVDVAALGRIHVVHENNPDAGESDSCNSGPVCEREVLNVLKEHCFQKHPRGSSPPHLDLNSPVFLLLERNSQHDEGDSKTQGITPIKDGIRDAEAE